VFALLLVVLASSPDAGTALLEVSARIPDAVVDLRYATTDNFMGQAVYPAEARCLLLEPSLKKLEVAASSLRARGFRVRLYDCYRPRAVQWQLWKVFPKPGFVADPRTGSNHNRGGAVDLSLVTLDGGPVEMPTPYDTFTAAAHQGFDGGTPASRAHREVLKAAMTAAGFTTNPREWWHYDLPDARRYPLRDEPFSDPARKE
jgi:zinc D-Ala-D-Ala dipeptidase